MDIELQEYIRAVSVLVLLVQCVILPSDRNINLRLSDTKTNHHFSYHVMWSNSCATELLSWMSFACDGILHIHLCVNVLCKYKQHRNLVAVISRFPLVICVQQIQAKDENTTTCRDQAKLMKHNYHVRINIKLQSQNSAITLHTVHDGTKYSSSGMLKNNMLHTNRKVFPIVQHGQHVNGNNKVQWWCTLVYP